MPISRWTPSLERCSTQTSGADDEEEFGRERETPSAIRSA